MKGQAIFLLGLFVLIWGCRSSEAGEEEGDPRCKREIVESYNLNGYLTPRAMSMFVCPGLKNSCCSLYDQFIMFTNWKDTIRPKLASYYESFTSKLIRLKELVSEVMETDFKRMLERLHIDDKAKENYYATFLRLSSSDYQNLIDEVIVMQKTNASYMMALRASFYCTICDYDSHEHFNLQKKTFAANMDTCRDIAVNTINFSHFMTVQLGGFLQSLSELMTAFALTEADKPIRIRNFDRVAQHVKTCAKQVAGRSGRYNLCKQYCQHWKINANSPVLEGYQIFINEIISSMGKFLKENSKEVRLLAEVPSARLDSGLSPNPVFYPGREDAHMEAYLKERFLAVEGETFFDPLQAKGLKDPYDENIIDPNLDDFTLNQMFNIQEDYEQERKTGYARFIASKIGQIDVEPDNNGDSEEEIFKTSSGIIVDLENFRTLVGGKGFDVSKHVGQNNINSSMRELVSNLKKKSKFEILYEKLDSALLHMVNSIDNDDVSNFHRDNFLSFTDFSADLKKSELEAKLNAS